MPEKLGDSDGSIFFFLNWYGITCFTYCTHVEAMQFEQYEQFLSCVTTLCYTPCMNMSVARNE